MISWTTQQVLVGAYVFFWGGGGSGFCSEGLYPRALCAFPARNLHKVLLAQHCSSVAGDQTLNNVNPLSLVLSISISVQWWCGWNDGNSYLYH